MFNKSLKSSKLRLGVTTKQRWNSALINIFDKKGRQTKQKYILTHLLKIVTASSKRLDNSLELDDLAL